MQQTKSGASFGPPSGTGPGLLLAGLDPPTPGLEFLDPDDLRFSLLFWDRLVWPYNDGGRIETDRSAEETFLVSCGILRRPEYYFVGEIGATSHEAHAHAFANLETLEPGNWAVSSRSLDYLNAGVSKKLAHSKSNISFELLNAVPIPDAAVPLNEILEFKAKRAAELDAFRSEIDGICLSVSNAADHQSSMLSAIERLDTACADVLSASKHWKYRMRLSDFNCTFEVKPFETLRDGLLAWGAAHVVGLPAAAAALSAAVAASACLKVSAKLTVPGLKLRTNPYSYIASTSKEMI